MLRLSILILLTFVTLTCFPQRNPTKRADKKYEMGEYYRAIKIYKRVLKRKDKKLDKPRKAEIIYRMADCYSYINDNRNAASSYKKAIQQKFPDPIAVLKLAEELRMNDKNAEAVIEYQNYMKLAPDDPRGEKGLHACELSIKWTENPTRYEVEPFKKINSKYGDFCPAYDVKKNYLDIYFTSSRKGTTGEQISNVSGQNFTDIFRISMDRKGKWGEPEPLDSLVNSIYDDGAPSLTEKANVMYFTRCRMEKDKTIGCQIFSSKKSGGEWSKAEKEVILQGNDNDSISVAHPAISADGKVLYFVTDMKGGYGGDDIWKVESKGKEWSDPVNLGPEVNTEFKEQYPYVRKDGILYFSSDRYPGMGGLDIFKAMQDSGKWLVENMQYPMNSFGDDFGIVFQGTEEKGLFSSSRQRRKDNIFEFVIPPISFTLTGTVKNKETQEVIQNAMVKLIGSDGTIFKDTTDEKGIFEYKLKPNTDYIFVAFKDGFLNQKGTLTTDSLDRSKDFVEELVLEPIDKPFEVPNIFYDFGSTELRPESMFPLNELIETLNDNSTITIELSSHSDMVGDSELNMNLSQKRAQSAINYLISKGINPDRLVPKGYGEEIPRVINKDLAAQYDFLNEGDVLNEQFILGLPKEQQDITHQLNRRTEFRVLSTDFVSKPVNN